MGKFYRIQILVSINEVLLRIQLHSFFIYPMAVFAQERQELSSYNKDHLALKVLNIYYVALYRKSLRTLVQVGRYKTSDKRSTTVLLRVEREETTLD